MLGPSYSFTALLRQHRFVGTQQPIACGGESDGKRSQADQQRNESYVQHADLRQL